MLPTRPGQRTLICILDWGLGHASRSLALANALERQGEETFFASCGFARLRRHLPHSLHAAQRSATIATVATYNLARTQVLCEARWRAGDWPDSVGQSFRLLRPRHTVYFPDTPATPDHTQPTSFLVIPAVSR